MRYIGNKTKLLGFIEKKLAARGLDHAGLSAVDPFSGTASVGQHLKKLEPDPAALLHLLERWRDERRDGERFGDYLVRSGAVTATGAPEDFHMPLG